MREIKFRGYCKGLKEWVFGYLLRNELGCFIVNNKRSEDVRMVDAESVGQFTGYSDKTGLPIYEGDIVEWDERDAEGQWQTYRVMVQFVDGGFYPLTENITTVCGKMLWMRRLGNMYETPQLLEEEL